MDSKMVDLISKSGFAVVAAIGMGWFIVSSQKDNRQEREQRQAEHKEERKEWVEVITSENALNRKTTEKLTDVVHSLEMAIAKDK